MSKNHRERTCRGKVRYRDRKEALRAVRKIASHSVRAKVPTRAYECSNCHGYHLTSRDAY